MLLKRWGKKEYKKFAMSMKPYLQPRESGIKDLGTYMDGVRAYLEDVEEDRVTVTGLDGTAIYGNAEAAVRETIDREMPVAYLMLKHRDKKFDFFEWHWFLVIGYDESDGGFMIKVATYGKAHWLSLKELWDTGFDEKGGLVLFEADQTEKEERDKQEIYGNERFYGDNAGICYSRYAGQGGGRPVQAVRILR